jgi:NADH-quinone oxidoreductase subunit G
MALGDYANSRGASDMGLLPDMLPGYALAIGRGARDKFGKLWGAKFRTPGLTPRDDGSTAVAGKLKALYVLARTR